MQPPSASRNFRSLLYSEESCKGTGVEIVPMTVLEYDYNSEWIIAKSGNKRTGIEIQYWIIKNDYDVEPTAEVIKSNVLGPLDLKSFSKELLNKRIELTLTKIE